MANPPPIGREPSAIAVPRVLGVGLLLACTVIVAVLVVHVVLAHSIAPNHAVIVARPATIPPTPRLQPHPATDLNALRAQKQALLSDWAWTDPIHDFARIPIESAMALYVQQHGNVPTTAHTSLRAPRDLLTQVGFDQNLGAQVPLDVSFRDARGATTRLRALLDGRPTLLVPGYYGCANLCDAVRAGVAHAAEKSGFVAGEQFNIVLISIDPHETPAQATVAQANDVAAHPTANVARWHYLTGAADASAALTHAIGFRYLFDRRNGQYDHTAGVVVLSPQGLVTQYLFGVQFPPQTLRLALVEASQGRIGNIVDRFVLLCCDYDPSTGRYSLLISRVMQGLGILTALLLCGLILTLRRRGLRLDVDRKST